MISLVIGLFEEGERREFMAYLGFCKGDFYGRLEQEDVCY